MDTLIPALVFLPFYLAFGAAFCFPVDVRITKLVSIEDGILYGV